MEAYVIVSYWWGIHEDNPRYAEEKRTERVVIGSRKFAQTIADDLADCFAKDSTFCYVEVEGEAAVTIEGK